MGILGVVRIVTALETVWQTVKSVCVLVCRGGTVRFWVGVLCKIFFCCESRCGGKLRFAHIADRTNSVVCKTSTTLSMITDSYNVRPDGTMTPCLYVGRIQGIVYWAGRSVIESGLDPFSQHVSHAITSRDPALRGARKFVTAHLMRVLQSSKLPELYEAPIE